MKRHLALFLSGAALLGGLVLHAQHQKAAAPAPPATTNDPYAWLEDVTGEKAMAWVRARNAESAKELESGETFKTLEADILRILDSDARIPYVSKEGEYYYNFWRDAKNPRGLWRRTTLEEYRKPTPTWETMLDVDARGLDVMDRKLLLAVIEKFLGGPVGLDNLAAAIGEESDTIEDVLEPYLIQQGYLQRTPRGRMATAIAYRHFGLTVANNPVYLSQANAELPLDDD